MEDEALWSYQSLASPPASPPTPPTINNIDLISNKVTRQHQRLNPTGSPGIRLLAASVQEGVAPEGAMPTAVLRGIVEAEGSIGQTHPREDKAGGSTQERQLGEHSGDESLWAAPREGPEVRWAPKHSCMLSAESGKGGKTPLPFTPSVSSPGELRIKPLLGCFELGRSGQGVGTGRELPRGAWWGRAHASTQGKPCPPGRWHHAASRHGREGSMPRPTTGPQARQRPAMTHHRRGDTLP